MPSIFTNGSSIHISGNNVTMINGKLYVDGVEQDVTALNGKIELIVQGDVGIITSDGSVTVNGNVKGDVRAGGSVQAEHVGGNITAGGSVRCSRVGGNINAGGSVRHA